MPDRKTMDLGSVNVYLKSALTLLVNLSFQPGRERKLASRGGGWARRAQAKIKVDKLENLYNMGFYEN